MIRVLQLNNSQLESSFNSLLEKHLVVNFPNQSNPNPIRSVIDRGNLRTQNVFLWREEKRPVHEIVGKRLQEELGSSDRTEELVKSSANTHTVEQFVPEEHRDIASFNADNEFNRAIDEENIDFNIPGAPNSMVKRSHGVNVHNLIQKIENHL